MGAIDQQLASTAYDRERRFLLCDQCGAPVDVSTGSGRAQCGFCRAELVVRMRAAAVASRSARSEGERLATLAGQDRRFLPPPEIAHLFVGERITPSGEGAARARFRELHHAALAGHPPAQHELFLLGIGLSELAFERGDLLGQRALVETALTALPSPERAQVFHAQLARCALRAGDIGAAEAWLSACNPAAEELLADSAYRFARAYVDTARNDFAAVIRVLGVGADVPLSDAYAPECAVLCANAWEKRDELATAIDALVSVKRELGPLARRRTARFVASHGGWSLCPRSEPEAERRVGRIEELPVEGGTIAGWLLTAMGAYSLLWGASGIALPIALAFMGQREPLAGFAASVLGGGVMGVILFPIGLLGLLGARRERRLRAGGIAYAAHVLGVRDLPAAEGSTHSVTIELSLLITPDDAPAYHSKLETSVLRVMRSNFERGRILVARVPRAGSHDFTLEVV